MNMIHSTFLPNSLLRNINISRTTYIVLLMFFILIPSIRTATFKYNPGSQSDSDIIHQGDAGPENDGIQLTKNRIDKQLNGSVGRALYAKAVRLWDSATGQVADFSTCFSFSITVPERKDGLRGDGLAFFLARNGSTLPTDSGGERLGLFKIDEEFYSSENPVVAVEFDTYYNTNIDPIPETPGLDHVGIDINSIRSVVAEQYNLTSHKVTIACISYNSSTRNMSVFVSPDSEMIKNPSPGDNLYISYNVNLKNVLPEWVSVGLTAATGDIFETHQILSWEFNSTEYPSSGISVEIPSPSPSPPQNRSVVVEPEHEKKTHTKLVIGLVVGISLFVVALGVILFMWQKKGKREIEEKITVVKSADMSTDDEYEHKTGPTKYAYSVLVRATDDFNEDRKLGEGGFGSVYRGTLGESILDVAVKKISQGSKQGKKEFVSEVTIIGKLVHRNLVQLLGWCQERSELLLVYEFMPNGSLDFHLFRGRSMLTWVLRYKIANDLASALLYLHEGLQQFVVHRDIKSSNILLDSDFNAKLGDFGLARFADHAEGLKTTMLGGTTGYIAPECFHRGKSSKESDIYSFGVVVLEIACGRRVLMPEEEENKVRLVSWVWELYVSGRLLEAADTKLGVDFDEQQMERLMVVGIWCATYDYNLRPSIKQVSSILNMEAPVPDLTMKIPLSTPFMPSMQSHGFSSASSSSATTDKQGYQSRTSGSTHQTSSTNSSAKVKVSSTTSLLHS